MSGRFSDFLERLDRQLKTFGSSLAEIGYGVGEETPRSSGLHPSALEKLARELGMLLLGAEKSPWMPDLRWYQLMVGPKYRRAVREVPERNEYTERDAAHTARLTHLVLVRAICGAAQLTMTFAKCWRETFACWPVCVTFFR